MRTFFSEVMVSNTPDLTSLTSGKVSRCHGPKTACGLRTSAPSAAVMHKTHEVPPHTKGHLPCLHFHAKCGCAEQAV